MRLKIIMLGLPILLSANVEAGDVEKLLKQQCTSCHGSELYTRPNRIVKNKFQLEKQLHRCNHAVGAKWDLDTVDEVLDYLNKKYYKFPG